MLENGEIGAVNLDILFQRIKIIFSCDPIGAALIIPPVCLDYVKI